MSTLTSKAARARLAVRRNPYFLKLADGCHLGFRRGPDTWIARCRDKAGQMHFKSLGAIAEFSEAKERAEEWLAQMRGTPTGARRRATVRRALEVYIDAVRNEQRRPDSADDIERVIRRAVYADPMADIELAELTIDDFKAWRSRLTESFGYHRVNIEIKLEAIRRIKAGERVSALAREYDIGRGSIYRWLRGSPSALKCERKSQSVNKYVAYVRAGLNAAVSEHRFVGNRAAWTMRKLPETDVDTRPFLTPMQRRELISHAAQLADFLRGLELTGARPGELAKATVADFDSHYGRITFRDKKGAHRNGVRVRHTVLSTEGAAFFRRQCRGKLPGAALFMSDDGSHWIDTEWGYRVRAAVEAANHGRDSSDPRYIPDGACAYSFRHSRISELLQVYKIDPLSVCKMTGTSVEMLRKHYWHLIADQMREALDAIVAKEA